MASGCDPSEPAQTYGAQRLYKHRVPSSSLRGHSGTLAQANALVPEQVSAKAAEDLCASGRGKGTVVGVDDDVPSKDHRGELSPWPQIAAGRLLQSLLKSRGTAMVDREDEKDVAPA